MRAGALPEMAEVEGNGTFVLVEMRGFCDFVALQVLVFFYYFYLLLEEVSF